MFKIKNKFIPISLIHALSILFLGFGFCAVDWYKFGEWGLYLHIGLVIFFSLLFIIITLFIIVKPKIVTWLKYTSSNCRIYRIVSLISACCFNLSYILYKTKITDFPIILINMGISLIMISIIGIIEIYRRMYD